MLPKNFCVALFVTVIQAENASYSRFVRCFILVFVKPLNESRCKLNEKQINSVKNYKSLLLYFTAFSLLNLKALLTCTPFNFVHEGLKEIVKAKLQNKTLTYFMAPHNYLERDCQHVCKQNTNYSANFAGLFSASLKCF